MRRLILALLLSSALPAAAQSNQPKDLRPVPEVPEPPELALPAPGADKDDPRLSPRSPLPSGVKTRSRNTG